jgi:hypothetical protein
LALFHDGGHLHYQGQGGGAMENLRIHSWAGERMGS